MKNSSDMTSGADWQRLRGALRDLHGALMERARRDYERERRVELKPGELLRLIAGDAYFSWLRALSRLMVDVDMAEEAGAAGEELAPAVRSAVDELLAAPGTTAHRSAFSERYWPFVQDDPAVAMAHAAVRQAIAAWPRPGPSDESVTLRERLAGARRRRRMH